jgi:polyisoprenyl-teichoic acid--peptidoglycan teichoic acid transferase
VNPLAAPSPGASSPDTNPPGRRSASLAILLSFLWPGLGQAYGGRRRAALAYGIPVLAVILILIIRAAGGAGELIELLVTPSSALTIAILLVLLGVWRVISMADAGTSIDRKRTWWRERAGVVFALLTALVVAFHGWAGWVAYAFYEASSEVYVAEVNPDASNPLPTAGVTPDPTDSYVSQPFATPVPGSTRINVLLTGVDSAAEREHALTDTLIVASINTVDRSAALISFPRDISNFPMFDGTTFKGKINSLTTYVKKHPAAYPDGPLPTLAEELGYLLGSPINYYAAIDLGGFAALIDAVGGVTIDNPTQLNDPRYDWMDGNRGFKLSPGVHKLDGRTALAYVRSRRGAGDNDFNRARRQQQVLLALRDKLTQPAYVARAPEYIRLFGKMVRTNIPPDQTGDLVDLAIGMDRKQVRQVVLGPKRYAEVPPASQTGGTYRLQLKLDALAQLSETIFGAESAYANGGGPKRH